MGRVIFKTEKTFPDIPIESTIPSSVEKGILSLEFGYKFLGKEWGQGFATEALAAVMDGLTNSKSYLSPYSKLYVEGICSHENPRSIRVVEKVGMKRLGLHSWEGVNIFLNGVDRDFCVLIYGKWLVE